MSFEACDVGNQAIPKPTLIEMQCIHACIYILMIAKIENLMIDKWSNRDTPDQFL